MNANSNLVPRVAELPVLPAQSRVPISLPAGIMGSAVFRGSPAWDVLAGPGRPAGLIVPASPGNWPGGGVPDGPRGGTGMEGGDGLGVAWGDWLQDIGGQFTKAITQRISTPSGTFRQGPDGVVYRQEPGYPVAVGGVTAYAPTGATLGIGAIMGIGAVVLLAVISLTKAR